MKKTIFLIVLLSVSFAALPLSGQQPERKEKPVMGYIIENGDTLYVGNLKPVYVYNRPKKNKNDKAWREYYRTVHNFAKAYPYALQAKARIDRTDSILASTHFTRKQREKYLQQVEKELFAEFEAPLRKLSFNQGRILLRLIDRELGQTTFYIVKDYRGGLTASFWQGVARLFGADMRKPYDKYGEDKVLEELVQMYHDGRFYYLYFSLFGAPKDPNISPYGTRRAN